MFAHRLDARQRQEAARLVQSLAKAVQVFGCGDQVEKVTMLAGGGVGPFAGCAAAGLGSAQADVEAPARRVPHVAHEPVGSLAPAIGEVVAADRLRVTGESVRQVRCGGAHRVIPKRKGPSSPTGPGERGFALLGCHRVVAVRDRAIFGGRLDLHHGRYAAVRRRFSDHRRIATRRAERLGQPAAVRE